MAQQNKAGVAVILWIPMEGVSERNVNRRLGKILRKIQVRIGTEVAMYRLPDRGEVQTGAPIEPIED